MAHYIYFIRAGGKNMFKVGITKNFIQRRNTLQTGCPFKISVYKLFVCDSEQIAREVEALIKDRIQLDLRSGGGKEWFILTPREVDTLIFEIKTRFNKQRDWNLKDV